MTESVILANVKAALPSLGTNFSYDEFDRMFQTPKYRTECAAYYQGARLSDKMAVVFDLADGDYYRFLNSVRIYGSDGRGGTKLLTEMRYPMYGGAIWSERTGQTVATNLIGSYIQDQCKVLGIPRPTDSQAAKVAEQFYDETKRATEALGKMALAAGNQVRALR